MAKKCQWCEIKENYHYWHNFPSTTHQFLVIMPYNLHQQLKIPQKFIECFKEKLSTWCTLIGPNENKWRVKCSSSAENEIDTIFTDGWEKFVNDHGIEVGDIVVFRYAGDSSFKVFVFDGKNSCEREGSHFRSNTSSSSHKVTCTSTLHNYGSSTSMSTPVPAPAPTPAPTPNPAAAPAAAAAAPAPAVGSSQKPIVIDEEDHEYDSATTVETTDEGYKDDQDESENEYVSGNRKTPQLVRVHISNRRDPTDEEKNIAVEKATRFMEAIARQNKIQSAPMFQITLVPSHVTKLFKLTIPNKWAIEHMVEGTRKVKLQVGNRSWIVGYRRSEIGNRYFHHYLNPNWPSFVVDNNLEVDDSCVFELIQKGPLPVFNVYISRAIYNIVPLTESGYRTKAKRKIELR